MSLQAAIERELPVLQAEAESLLPDRCDLQRKSGATIDPVSLAATDVWTTYRSTPCRVRQGTNQQATTVVVGQAITTTALVLSVPMSVVDVHVDDRAIITESGDASLVGVALYVRAVPRGSQMTLRRLPVSEVQG